MQTTSPLLFPIACTIFAFAALFHVSFADDDDLGPQLLSASLVSKINASDGASNDKFGFTTSISGKWAVVGAYQCEVDSITQEGCAYIYYFDDTTNEWDQTQKLTVGTALAYTGFGSSVSICGNNMIIGTNKKINAAYIYSLNSSTMIWDGPQMLRSTSPSASSEPSEGLYARVVDIAENYAVVADTDDGTDGNDAGLVYVYTINETTGLWYELQTFNGDSTDTQDSFGTDVGITSNGRYIIVGATGANNNTEEVVNGPGAVYFFKRDDVTGFYEQVKVFYSETSGETFGTSVGITIGSDSDYYYAAVGTWAGSLYVYQIDGDDEVGEWEQLQKLSGSSQFGRKVTISGDLLATGNFDNDADDVYIYERVGNEFVYALNEFGVFDNYNPGRFIDVDGYSIIIGAESESYDTGAAYIYDLTALTEEPTDMPLAEPTSIPSAPSQMPSVSGDDNDDDETSDVYSSTQDGGVAQSDDDAAHRALIVLDTWERSWIVALFFVYLVV